MVSSCLIVVFAFVASGLAGLSVLALTEDTRTSRTVFAWFTGSALFGLSVYFLTIEAFGPRQSIACGVIAGFLSRPICRWLAAE